MKRKKSPNKARQKTPVMNGDCFATFIREAQSIGAEVTARREWDRDVCAFLAEKGLMSEWDAWLEKLVLLRRG
jgi:hypothetical protein